MPRTPDDFLAEFDREQAASWYDAQAAQTDSGAWAVMCREWAGRIRNGDADHRLGTLLTGQSAFEAEAA